MDPAPVVRILVSGSTGFVGNWLTPELELGGHTVIGMPDPDVLDIADAPAVRLAIANARPDAVVHLAAVAFAPDAAGDAAEAVRVNVGGTLAILEGCRQVIPGAAVLLVSSSEVYQVPDSDTPLTEASPVAPRGVYGLTKLAAEALGVATGINGDLRIAVARSFNHTGPGQRQVFAVPAFARRVLEARAAGVHEIPAGNVDVARDISDVRDVVRAYRLLLEALMAGYVPARRPIFNVASGSAVTMRSIIDQLSRAARWEVSVTRDADLVRADDAPMIRGDTSALRALTGWQPAIPLAQTLSDIVWDLEATTPQGGRPIADEPVQRTVNLHRG